MRARTWRKAAAMLVLGILCLAAARAAGGCAVSARSACRFIHYYRALESRPIGLWERVLYSLFLAGAPKS